MTEELKKRSIADDVAAVETVEETGATPWTTRMKLLWIKSLNSLICWNIKTGTRFLFPAGKNSG